MQKGVVAMISFHQYYLFVTVVLPFVTSSTIRVANLFNNEPNHQQQRAQDPISKRRSFKFDEKLLDLSIQAAELSSAIFDTNANIDKLPDDVLCFVDEPDEAMIAKIDGVCYVVFRGTTRTMEDWEQNLNPGMADDVCLPSSDESGNVEEEPTKCCRTRQGFRDAYVETNYRPELEAEVRKCAMNTANDNGDKCSDSNSDGYCDIVLTGHSQGGAIAQISYFKLTDLNPIIITFGQPPTMEEDKSCTDVLNSGQMYRFVNTVVVNGGRDLVYDIVPFLDVLGNNLDQYGQMITLSSQDNHNVAYYEDHNAPNVGPGDRAYINMREAHDINTYLSRLYSLKMGLGDTFSTIIGIDGWSFGTKCSRNSECITPHICNKYNYVCSDGEFDSPCWENHDCLSRRCEGWTRPTCQSRLSSGSRCNENSDCMSSLCRWYGKCE